MTKTKSKRAKSRQQKRATRVTKINNQKYTINELEELNIEQQLSTFTTDEQHNTCQTFVRS